MSFLVADVRFPQVFLMLDNYRNLGTKKFVT
jgi:hypothetical protein